MSKYLTPQQERSYNLIKNIREELAEVGLINVNCPLLHSQATELLLLSSLMQKHLKYLLDTVDKK